MWTEGSHTASFLFEMENRLHYGVIFVIKTLTKQLGLEHELFFMRYHVYYFSYVS